MTELGTSANGSNGPIACRGRSVRPSVNCVDDLRQEKIVVRTPLPPRQHFLDPGMLQNAMSSFFSANFPDMTKTAVCGLVILCILLVAHDDNIKAEATLQRLIKTESYLQRLRCCAVYCQYAHYCFLIGRKVCKCYKRDRRFKMQGHWTTFNMK